MKLVVVDREQIEMGILVRGRYIVITIADPGMSQAEVKQQSGLLDVLPLYFHDAEPWPDNPPHIRLISDEDVQSIHDFVIEWKGKADAIVVNCIAGMSRSPAVGIGICKAMSWPHQHIVENSQPNEHVLRCVFDFFCSQE